MRPSTRVAASLIFMLTGVPSMRGAEPSVQQNWVGELHLGDGNRLVQVRLSGDHTPASGTIGFPASGIADTPVSNVVSDQRHVKFEWVDPHGPASFEGIPSAGLVQGTVRVGEKQGTMQLAPTVTLSPEAQDRLAGYYEMQPGHVLSVTNSPSGPVYVDFTTGRLGVLFPSSQETFFAGPAFQVPVPVDIRCRVTSDPATNRITLDWHDGASRRIGHKLDLRQEDVTFRSGDVVLSGTLVLPSGPGPHSAMVRIHGAGPQTRRSTVNGWYAYHGVAYLSFDKRGTGTSTGDWREAGISELADDVLAAVRFLRQRKDIDPAQIGIEAVSEGGWIAPVVATRDSKIRFVTVIAGPALDYVPELMNEVEERLKARGLSGDDLTKALAFRRQASEMIANGAGLSDEAWAELQKFAAPYHTERWFPYVSVPEQRSPAQKKLYLMARVRSSEFWRQVKTPVLAVYGGKDLNVPAAKNVVALTEELRAAGNRDVTIKLFPRANHEFLETDNAMPDDEQARYVQRQVPGFFDTQLSWVLSHVGKTAPPR